MLWIINNIVFTVTELPCGVYTYIYRRVFLFPSVETQTSTGLKSTCSSIQSVNSFISFYHSWSFFSIFITFFFPFLLPQRNDKQSPLQNLQYQYTRIFNLHLLLLFSIYKDLQIIRKKILINITQILKCIFKIYLCKINNKTIINSKRFVT